MQTSWDRRYLVAGLAYAVIGMGVGLFMAASHIHVQSVTHAHVLLVGFLLSLIYAIIHKLWLFGTSNLLSRLQFACHHTGAVVMLSGLFLLYQNLVPPEMIEPVLGISSTLVMLAMILMLVMVVKSEPAPKLANE